MSAYIFRRLAFLFLTLTLTSILIFLITQLLPGDVCRVILGREVGEGALEACRLELGLHDPALIRYLNWFVDFLAGDWGLSFSTNVEIQPLVIARLGNSLRLALFTLIISVPIATILGAIAALNENNWIDNIINISSLSVVGLPEFVTGIILIELLAFNLGLPANSSIPPGTSFIESIPSLFLPALTASLVLLAYIARLTRAGVLEELKKDYVRTAYLKGLSRQAVLFKHVLRNALFPTITVVAISFGWLISGLIVIENVFNYPGLGRLMTFAISRRDLPMMQAISVITVIAFALANLAADILSASLNPRLRIGE